MVDRFPEVVPMLPTSRKKAGFNTLDNVDRKVDSVHPRRKYNPEC